MNPHIRLRDLRIGYEKAITTPLTVTFDMGVSVLLGRNGVGKTTLLRTVAGVLQHRSGTIDLAGEIRTGSVGHLPALAARLTVQENLMFWARAEGLPRNVAKATVRRAIDDNGLRDLACTRVERLSHGQSRMVDVVRATMLTSKILLLDEPFNGLDPVHASAVRELLTIRARNSVVLISTHSIADAGLIADRLYVLRSDSIRAVDRRLSDPANEHRLVEILNEDEE